MASTRDVTHLEHPFARRQRHSLLVVQQIVEGGAATPDLEAGVDGGRRGNVVDVRHELEQASGRKYDALVYPCARPRFQPGPAARDQRVSPHGRVSGLREPVVVVQG